MDKLGRVGLVVTPRQRDRFPLSQENFILTLFELGTLMTVINLCKEAIRLERWKTARANALADDKLTTMEAELLHAAAQCGNGNGIIQLVQANSVLVPFASGKLFDGAGNAYARAKYIEAFMSLCSRGLVNHSGACNSSGQPNGIFLITASAFDLDRDLHT